MSPAYLVEWGIVTRQEPEWIQFKVSCLSADYLLTCH